MLGYPGMGEGGTPMPGDDPALPDDLVQPHIAQQARDVQTGAQSDALMSGDMEAKVASMLEGVLTSLATAALSEMAKTDEGRGRVGQFRDLITGAAGQMASTAPNPPGPSPQAAQAPPEAAPPPSGQEFYHPVEAYREGRDAPGKATMGSVARAVAAPAAKYFSQRNAGWSLEEQPDGTQAYVRRDPNDPNADPANGNLGAIVETVPEDDPRFAHLGRSISRAGFVSGNLAAMAGGEGVAGSLGATAARVAGPIGLAVGAVQMGGNFFESQIQRGAGYRQAFGEEGTGGFSARERMGEFVAGLQGFGSIGGDRAREQYRAASEMGLRGDRREQASDFAGSMYQRFGIDTAESMQIVEQAINAGNISLTQFGEAITEVSRAAVEAGRSSKEAIDDFVAAQKNISTNLVGGGASVEVTEQIDRLAAGMDRGLLKSVGGVQGLSTLLNQQNIMGVAAMTGQDPSAALFRSRDPSTAAAQAQDTISGIGQRIVQIIAATLGTDAATLTEEVRRRTGGRAVSSEQQFSIFLDLCGGSERAGGVLTQVLQQVTAFFRIQIDEAQLLNLFFTTVQGGLGQTTAQEEAQGTARGMGQDFLQSTGLLGTGAGSTGGSTGNYQRISTPSASDRQAAGYAGVTSPTLGAWNSQKNEILSNLGYAPANPGLGLPATGPQDSAAFGAYVDYVAKTGKGNPQIEALLNPQNQQALIEKAGVGDAEDVKFRVGTGKGSKDLSLAQIISSGNKGYLSQLTSGDAGIVPSNRSDNPSSVGEVTHVHVEVEAIGDLRGNIRARSGPTEDQRSGIPAPAYRSPATFPQYGGQ